MRNKKLTKNIALVLVSAVLWFNMLSAPSYSQTQEFLEKDTLRIYQIDEIVTTGTRTSKRIIDIPYSVERIDNAQYRFDRKLAVSDVMETIPGLFLQSRYGNHDVRVSIRGFGSRSNSGIRGVRILLDGIPESEPDGQTRIEALDFQSIGSIEVVKGNSSSLYTNAPGGVINFISDIYFPRTFAVSFNEFGSFDYRSNGLKTGVRTDSYAFLLAYNYHNARGYRAHSEDYWNIVNSVLETKPTALSRLAVYVNFVDGIIRLPGSLKRAEFDLDPFQANRTDVSRDSKRITRKGRLGLRFETFFGERNNQEIELTAYGTMKYFERTSDVYRIFNRDGVGASSRYVFRSEIAGNKNEFSVGGDLFFQSGPIESYPNINGKKGDGLVGDQVVNETIGNTGFYVQNSFGIIKNRVDLLITGRYDNVVFDSKNAVLEAKNSVKRFEKFTPKVALNYKITPTVAAYASYGTGFDTPAFNELDNYPTSSDFPKLLNPDLQPQKSENFEAGIKGNLVSPDADYFKSFYGEVTFFHSTTSDEIVPFEDGGEVFYRNAAQTNRTGLELKADVEIIQGLRLRTAYALSDFSYESYVARIVDNDGNIRDNNYAGNIVPSVPKHNFSLVLSYTRSITEHITGFIKGNYNNVSGMYTDDQNSERTRGYQLVNATVGLDIVVDRCNVLASAGVNNMFDRLYAAFININSTSQRFYEAGEPRNYFGSIRLGYSF